MLLEKLRANVSTKIEYEDQDGNPLSHVGVARIKLHESRQAYIGMQKSLHNKIRKSDESEDNLKSQIALSSDLVNKGEDSVIVTFKHQQERLLSLESVNLLQIQELTQGIEDFKEQILVSHIGLMKSLTKYGDYMYKNFMAYSKDVPRKKMPQIDDNDKLKKTLDLKEEKMQIQLLKPYQNEIDKTKTDTFLAGGYSIPKSWIVSSDNYMMDGHHRWAATMEIYEPEEDITVYRSDKTADDLYKELTTVRKSEEQRFIDALLDIDIDLYKAFVTMPMEDFVKEHKDIVELLRHGNDEELEREAVKQQEELDEELKKKDKKDELEHYAAGIYQNEEGKILFLQRHMDDTFYPKTWNLPAGGIEEGETPEDALKREFKEETNLEVASYNEAKVITEGGAMIHYYWVTPKEGEIALLDTESQQYAWWDIDEFRDEDLILQLEDHLMQILLPSKMEKAEGNKMAKDGTMLVPKQVLVKQKGKKVFWQTKWVKAMVAAKMPKTKITNIEFLAKKIGVDVEALEKVLDDIENIIIDGDEYEIDKKEGDYLHLAMTGISTEKKKKKGWFVVVKEDSKIKKQEGKTKKDITLDTAEQLLKTAHSKKMGLDVSGHEYKFLEFNKINNTVKLSIDGGEPYEDKFDHIAKVLWEELKKKKAEFEQLKKFNKPMAITDDDFVKVKNLGGSTGAVLVKDKKNKLWVRKGGANKGHRENELLALNLYKQMGVHVPPETKVTKNYIYNRYVDGKSLGEWMVEHSDKELKEMYAKISKGFVVDALLGAWDVIGLDKDNIIIDKSGIPIRVDVGGALGYRAQGEKKKKGEWEEAKEVAEIETLRDYKLNSQSAHAFADITLTDIMTQVDHLPEKFESWIPLPQRKVLSARLAFLKDGFEGLPTNLDHMGDLYKVPKDANKDVKTFYQKLNKLIAFTPKDQKILTLMAEHGDDYAKQLSDEGYAKSYVDNAIKAKHLIQYRDKLGLNNRELMAIKDHTGGGSSSINGALKSLVGGEYNLVESGQVVKYKPEFADAAKKAFNQNNMLHSELNHAQKIVNFAKEGSESVATGAYGVGNMQNLRELVGVLDKTFKNAPNEIEQEIAGFYKDHASNILKAFETKQGYTEPIGVYIPSDKLKDKYAEVVDLSFATNEINWTDIIAEAKGKAGKGSSDMENWSNKNAIKYLMVAKLATRGLVKAERNKDKSPYANNGTPISRKISPYDMNNFLDQHQEGNVVHWSNVSSCSESFAVWNGSVKTRIVPIGALRTKYLSSYEGSEIENTMKPFPRLKITNVKKEGGETYINITQVG